MEEPTEVSQCDIASQVDLLKRIYNIRMDTPNTTPQTMTLSVFNVEVAKKAIAAALVISLLEKDNPDFYWDILKEYIKNVEKHGTISRVSMKRLKEPGVYWLVILLNQIPDEEILRSVRSLVRPFVGHCSAYFATTNKTIGIPVFTSMRLAYSETTLTITGSNKRSRFSSVVNNEAQFREIISKQHNEGIAFRLCRTFLDQNIIDEFTARVMAPMHARKIIFEKVVCLLYYSNIRWSDNIAFIDLRSENGNLKFTIMFRLLKEKERHEVQDFVIAAVRDLYIELTGKFVQTGSSEVIHMPARKHVLVKAEPKEEHLEINNSNSGPTPLVEKKKHKKTRARKNAKSSPKECKTDDASIEAEWIESTKKPACRPEILSQFENWLFDLTDEEFDKELEKFSKRLDPLNFTPEMNYWKAFAFQDGVALTDIIDQHDIFFSSPGNFSSLIGQVYQNTKERRNAKNILLMLVNRNYINAGPVIATITSMSCQFRWCPQMLPLITKLVNRYVPTKGCIASSHFLDEYFDELERVLSYHKTWC